MSIIAAGRNHTMSPPHRFVSIHFQVFSKAVLKRKPPL
jgi:hypothetical protein